MTGSLIWILILLRRVKEFRSYMSLSSARRAATLTFSYCTTAVVFVAVFIFLKGILSPESLQDVLSYIFISGIAAGIEPGTAKMQLLRASSHVGTFRFAYPWILIGSTGKAIALSPLLFSAWYLTNHGGLSFVSILLWSPVVAAVGFMTTELRAIFDANGRYASAIWLKQGSLSIGILSLAVAIGSNLSLQVALAISLFVRLFWLTIFIVRGRGYLERKQINRERISNEMLDYRWIEFVLTSVLATVGGSLDRIVAFRYLDATEANSYFVIYELLSKFWLISYLFSPIVFAKRVRHQNQSRFVGIALLGTGGIGLVFIAVVMLIIIFWPHFLEYVSNGIVPSLGICIFAAAIVLASLSMLFNADLQGMGKTKEVATISFLGVIISAVSFYVLTFYFGLNGLYFAWLIKTTLEILMILIFVFYLRRK